MGKKIPLLISTLIALGSSSMATLPVWADETKQTYWTISELQSLSAKVDAEIDATCQAEDYEDNFLRFMCVQDYLDTKDEDIYHAFNNFQSYPFYISAINPGKGTIRVFYSGEDAYSKYMDPDFSLGTLADLYIVQFDRNTSSDFIGDLDNSISNPHTHTLVYEKQNVNGEGWFPSGVEVEFRTPELVASLQREEALQFFYTTSSGASYIDPYNFASCVESLDYRDGMECRLIFKRDRYVYIPVIAEDTNNTTALDTSKEDSEGYGATVVEPAQVSIADDATQDAENYPVTSAETTIKTPNTGAYTQDSDSEGFPWWLGVIIGLNVLVLIWLFLPIREQKRKKS